MKEDRTSLESVEQLRDEELAALRERDINSVEDLLAKIVSYKDQIEEVAQLLGIEAARIPPIVKEARTKVGEGFLEMLDEEFNSSQFFLGALPPKEKKQ